MKPPVTFDLPSNTTIDKTGAQSISIRTTGQEKTNFTVVLSCKADGTKLPPLIIFKLKKIPCGNFPSEVIVRANQTGWGSSASGSLLSVAAGSAVRGKGAPRP